MCSCLLTSALSRLTLIKALLPTVALLSRNRTRLLFKGQFMARQTASRGSVDEAALDRQTVSQSSVDEAAMARQTDEEANGLA